MIQEEKSYVTCGSLTTIGLTAFVLKAMTLGVHPTKR
jgi:hypothetical protein